MSGLIKSSVGFHGVNTHSDLKAVNMLLARNGIEGLEGEFVNTGNSIRGIVAFQNRSFIPADGLVKPDSLTLKLLLKKNSVSLYRNYDNVSVRYEPQLMDLSSEGVWLMKNYEMYKQYPYDDQTGRRITSHCKGATIGYGHLLSRDEFPKYTGGISEFEATRFFNIKIEDFIKPVRSYVKTKLTQGEFDALVMLTYNIGPRNDKTQSGFYHSEILKIINGESVADLEKAWGTYVFSQGHIMQGLMNRRQSEWKVFNNNGYAKL